MAVIAALKWVAKMRVQATLWIDALHVARSPHGILQGVQISTEAENGDLWAILEELVLQLEPNSVTTQHIPSHLDVSLCTSEFEEWVSAWNQHADTVAAVANACRPHDLLEVHSRAHSSHQRLAGIFRSLRNMFFHVADVGMLDKKPLRMNNRKSSLRPLCRYQRRTSYRI